MDLPDIHRQKDIGRVGKSLYESIKTGKFPFLNLNYYSLHKVVLFEKCPFVTCLVKAS